MDSVANRIRSVVARLEYEVLKDLYKKTLQSFVGKHKEYGINRDGDVYQVACPSCRTKMIAPAGCGIFVCKKNHVFSAYTEDGVQEIKEDMRVDGPDLQKDGKDSHGHNAYVIYKSDEKSPISFCYWMHYAKPGDGSPIEYTIQDVSDAVWTLKSKVPAIGDMYLHYYVEADTMMGGRPVASIGSQIKTWPEFMSNMKWFVVLPLLEGTDWKISFVQEGER